MKAIWKKFIVAVVAASAAVNIAGCSHRQKKNPKPQPQATVVVDNGNTDAKGKGEGQSDVPLVIGCNKLDRKFNPFVAESEDDIQAVALTQIYLLENDRRGQIIYNGIDGEVKPYNGSDYTYYGPADMSIKYNKKKNETVYRITLRNDLDFSDGEHVTIDDVIFTMYVLCDKSYKGSSQLGKQAIKGLLRYQANKKVKKISGIRRINDYMVSITTDGFSKDMAKALQIPVCPLHYYGNIEKYNYNKNRFGFKKGNISSVCANKSSPVGAGPYRFVKYEKKIIYYTSNEIYYKGCPKIAYVQLKEMKQILNAARKKIDRMEAVETGSDIPEDTVNRNAEALEMTEGTVDVTSASLSKDDLFWVAYANSNGKLSGNSIMTDLQPSGIYQYIGINAQNVKTGKKAYSVKSKYLRRAFATAFTAYRSSLYDYYGEETCIIQYPYSSVSWLMPDDEENISPYNKDINGDIIYNGDTDTSGDAEEKYEDVRVAVLSYLEAAGYTVNGGKIVKAPQGARKTYSVLIAGGADNPLYKVISDTASLFADIGMKLDIVSISGYNSLENKIAGGKQQMWVAECNTGKENMHGRYLSRNDLFGLSGSRLGRQVIQAEKTVKAAKRKKKYTICYNSIINQAVEIPVNELQMAVLYSSKRIDMDTMTENATRYYSWVKEIEKIKMK